jgi:uncharacterized protein YbbC (DUF1343 family)
MSITIIPMAMAVIPILIIGPETLFLYALPLMMRCAIKRSKFKREMTFRLLKNTVLFFLLLSFSCLDNSSANSLSSTTSYTPPQEEITVGANRTTEYLGLLKDKRIAVVANQTSVIFKNSPSNYTHLVDSLVALNIEVAKVFAPEHGFRGTADAGEYVKDGLDEKTGIPVISLYGKNKKPKVAALDGLDMVLFDIQDVGVRFYTYISTLHYVMEACAEQGLPLLILDRPNPNGSYVDGPVLEKEHSSFLGMHPVPLVHGMTIGEYAQMINGESWLKNDVKCHLIIVPTANYRHSSSYSLPIRPSPNLPNDMAIKLYPSLGLFEGTNVNAGRGTDFQFQRYGAPFMDSTSYVFSYTPKPNFGSKDPKHNGIKCFGKDLSKITFERGLSLYFLIDAYKNSTDKAAFFNSANFTLHAGTEELQKQIELGWNEQQIKDSWQSELNRFSTIREKYLLYP